MKRVSLKEWADYLAASRIAADVELAEIVNLTAKAGATVARGYIGHEQPAMSVTPPPVSFPAWQPLAASTIADKSRLGFGPPDYEPLRRSGAMEQSIAGESVGLIGAVGATDPKMAFHEAGTSKMPPRPVLARSVAFMMPLLDASLGRLGIRLLVPGSR